MSVPIIKRNAHVFLLYLYISPSVWILHILDLGLETRTSLPGGDVFVSTIDAVSSYGLALPAAAAVFAAGRRTARSNLHATIGCSLFLAHASTALHSIRHGLLAYIADHAGINAVLVLLIAIPVSTGRQAGLIVFAALAWLAASAAAVAEALGAPLDTFESFVPTYLVLAAACAAGELFDVLRLARAPAPAASTACKCVYLSSVALLFRTSAGALYALPTAIFAYVLLDRYRLRYIQNKRYVWPRAISIVTVSALVALYVASNASRGNGVGVGTLTMDNNIPHWAWHIIAGSILAVYTSVYLAWPSTVLLCQDNSYRLMSV